MVSLWSSTAAMTSLRTFGSLRDGFARRIDSHSECADTEGDLNRVSIKRLDGNRSSVHGPSRMASLLDYLMSALSVHMAAMATLGFFNHQSNIIITEAPEYVS